MKKKEREILNFIKVLRKSFIDAKIVYKFWACYGMYEILKTLYPNSVWYLIDWDHVLTKIEWIYYDISWKYDIEEDETLEELDEELHYMADSWRDGQRLERMLKKYSDIN